MADIKLTNDEILVSYDVRSLFTSIPIDQSITSCEKKLRQDESLNERTTVSVATIIQLLRFCLTSTNFQFNGQHYRQLEGVAMGSPVSSVIADIFMADFEETALDNYACPPRIWLRFVDDVLSVIQANPKATFLEHLNAQNKSIQFTMEEELDHSLPFKDVNFTREADGHLARQVHQKSTHTNRYVQFDSHHPAAVKAGIVQCLAQRA